MTWCARVVLAAVLPLLLAAVAVQELSGSRGLTAAPPMVRVLVWGPLLETVLLLTAARLVDRVMSAPRPAKAGRPPWGTSKVAEPHLLVRPAGLLRRTEAANTGRFVACTLIVGFSFWATHVVQNGSPAWATLPMALVMAAYAARHAGDPPGKLCKVVGPMLFTMHAVYNAGILVLAQD